MIPRRSGGGGTAGSDVRMRHIPVALPQVLELLAPKDGETYIDGTFGAGGYARAMLEAAACDVLALDRDPSAVRDGLKTVLEFCPRLRLVLQPFSNMAEIAAAWGVAPVDGVVLDVGVSSMQLDEPTRGFSFLSSGPLDMRMFATPDGASAEAGASAADVVNGFDEERLANIIYQLGEERRSRSIARAIVKARSQHAITTTGELADIVSNVFHGRKIDGRHPATRTFQALRIFVNDELGELARGLSAAEQILKPGGRLVVVTFHSLEDRIVKRFLAERSGKQRRGSRHLPEQSVKIAEPSFRIVNPRPFTPCQGELELNPRARSARVRAAARTEAGVVPLDAAALGAPAP